MADRRKRVADLVTGDGVVLQPPLCHGVIVSNTRSRHTYVQSRQGHGQGVAMIVVFDVVDGPLRGAREADFRHPEDEVLWRTM